MVGSAIAALLAGFGAGALGALLGLGGAIVLIPVLNLGLGLPYRIAAGISLMTVVATSSVVSRDRSSRPFVNGRLAVLLLVMTVLGASAGLRLLGMPDLVAERIFGVTAVVVAVVMVLRLRRRNVIVQPGIDPGALGGRFRDADLDAEVVYRVRRVPLALAIAFVAGGVSTVVGVGGGILLVPMLNSLCGVPLRAAAATSALMVGITAVPGVIGHYDALVLPLIEIAAVAGVIAGSKAGFWISARSPVQALKLLMAGILLVVGGTYLVRAGTQAAGDIAATMLVDPSPAWLRAVVSVGLVVLVLIPIGNVVEIAMQEWRRRQWGFVAAAAAVLAMLAIGLLAR